MNKGHKTRKIAKMTNVSKTTIKKMGQKLQTMSLKRKNEPKDKPLSASSQAFKLFLEGKPVVRVAIELDVPTDRAIRIYKDYLTLQTMSKIVFILNKHGKAFQLL